MSQPKYQRVAALVRAQIADGTLQPGGPAPSGAALSRVTGYSTRTCSKALSTLIKGGVLIPGSSPHGRPRVPPRADEPAQQARATVARALSGALGARRHAAELTQPQLAEIIGVSVTTVGHAETGRLWQSRRFWEGADEALGADGALVDLHNAYRAATIPADPASTAQDTGIETAGVSPATTVVAFGPVICVTITWADGAVSTVFPPVPQP